MKELFRVLKQGVYASMQDKGRYGFRKYGMPVAGVMDSYAYRIGNDILNHSDNVAALEIFLGGLSLEVLCDHSIVITGADLSADLDGVPVPLWKSFNISKGQILNVKKPKEGSVAYITPYGGFICEEIMGSRSAFPKGQIGSVLKKGDILSVVNQDIPKYKRGLMLSEIPRYENDVKVKVWESPHLHLFKEDSVKAFFDGQYTYRGGDRMGYYVSGPELQFINGSDILSEATQYGTIQVPSNGQPIILMADAQTIGGYATIGKVFEEDLWKIAQLRNGGKITFIKQLMRKELCV